MVAPFQFFTKSAKIIMIFPKRPYKFKHICTLPKANRYTIARTRPHKQAVRVLTAKFTIKLTRVVE